MGQALYKVQSIHKGQCIYFSLQSRYNTLREICCAHRE